MLLQNYRKQVEGKVGREKAKEKHSNKELNIEPPRI